MYTLAFSQLTQQLKGLVKILFQHFFHMVVGKSALKYLQRVCNDGSKTSGLPLVKHILGTVVLSVWV